MRDRLDFGARVSRIFVPYHMVLPTRYTERTINKIQSPDAMRARRARHGAQVVFVRLFRLFHFSEF
jgi:hypothetical protein